MDTKSPKVLSISHGRRPLLFIAPRAKLAVTPSLGKNRADRTLDLSVRSSADGHASRSQRSLDLTGRSGKTDRTLKPQRPVVSSKLPEAYFLDRTRPVHLDRTQTSVRCNTLGTEQTRQFDRTQPFSVRSLRDPASGQKTEASVFAINSFSLLTSSPLLQCANHKNLHPAQ